LNTSAIRPFDLVVVQELLKHRGLENAEANPQADADENDREREGDAPAPHQELVARHPRAEDQHRKIRQKQPAGDAELRPGGDEAALAMGARPFHGQKHGTTPLPADADTLHGAQDGEHHRAPNADRRIGRHKRDQEGCDAHAQERGDQRGLAADAVAIVAEDRGADWAGRKADEVGSERKKGGRVRVLMRKEELAEDETGRGAVEKEVVPLY